MKETCAAAGLKCSESYPDEEPRFKSEASIALFRIAQEAFSNILKHSRAKTADISLDMDDETLLMRIADDGIGMPAGQFTAIGSHGLASMRHRVRALGGRLDVRKPAIGRYHAHRANSHRERTSRKSANPHRLKDEATRGISADRQWLCRGPCYAEATPRVGLFYSDGVGGRAQERNNAPRRAALDVLNPPDWYPAEHPAMPAVVAHGSPPQGREDCAASALRALPFAERRRTC